MKSLKKLLRASRREKASAHEDAKSTAQRAAGQSVKQNWDCSQIETEEEEEEEDWQKEDQMCNGLSMTSWRRFWNEEEWEEVLCKRMSCKRYLIEGKKARGTEEKKKVKVWSTEKVKNKPRDDREDDTGVMVEWRSMSQEEMDQCWKKLAEKIEEEVLEKYKVADTKRGAYRGRASLLEWRRVRKSRKDRI